MADQAQSQPEPAAPCRCFAVPFHTLELDKEFGMDGSFAQVSLLNCAVCGQRWLRYFYEIEAFSSSGRWYLGAINTEQASRLQIENARAILENLDWYFYGGSYYGGWSGKTSGRIMLNP